MPKNRNTPEIETERLILRKFTPQDVEAFHTIMRDRETNTYLPLFPARSQAEAFLHDAYLRAYDGPIGFRYAICLLSDNVPIGYAAVADNDSHDLGYGLRREFWHKGIVTEACGVIVGEMRKAGLPYITATHDINNPRSGNVMRKIGMTYCYSYHERWMPKDIMVTFRMYQLNLDGRDRVYLKYWMRYPGHFVERDV